MNKLIAVGGVILPGNSLILGGNTDPELGKDSLWMNLQKPDKAALPSPLPSIPAKGTVVENSEILHVNEADRSVGFLPNFNGKPSSGWNFEEIIDLGVHPKTARLSSESIAADMPGQNFRGGTPLPASPKLAFEEDGGVNSLTKSIEAASGKVYLLLS